MAFGNHHGRIVCRLACQTGAHGHGQRNPLGGGCCPVWPEDEVVHDPVLQAFYADFLGYPWAVKDSPSKLELRAARQWQRD